MVAVVGSMMRQLEGGQLRMRVTDVDMVNPSSSNVSRTSHKLLETKVTEGCGEETVWMFVQADVHVARDSCQSLHVNQLLQVVHQLLLASIGRPFGRYLMYYIFVRYLLKILIFLTLSSNIIQISDYAVHL